MSESSEKRDKAKARIAGHTRPGDGTTRVTRLELVGGEGNVLASRALSPAVRVPDSGSGRGDALTKLNQRIVEMRQATAGRPDAVDAIEQELD